MSLDRFEEIILSPEQERQKEQFPKLFAIAQRFYSSSDNVDKSIYADKKRLEESIKNEHGDPGQYYFWSLLDHTISSNENDYDAVYDTKDNAIEKFFLKLENKMNVWEKVNN